MKSRRCKVVKYVGNGAFFSGLPARDMTLEEWESYPEELRSAALSADLYLLPVAKKSGKPEVMEERKGE